MILLKRGSSINCFTWPLSLWLRKQSILAAFCNKCLLYFLVFSFAFLFGEEELQPDLTVAIPMRDGVLLPTDLYFSPGQNGKLPCILLRSPAGRKAKTWLHLAKLSQKGYVVAIQDTRSAQDKEGKTIPFLADGWGALQDGYDTVEWLAASEYTNGKVGTIGFSALGITQQMMAPSAPPSLKCQYIGVAAGCLYHHATYVGGQLLKNQVEGWLSLYAKDPIVYNFLRSQPRYNEFWSLFNSLSMAHRVTTPAIHYGGWFDIFLKGTIDSFVARQEGGAEGARGQQKLLIGPWTHHWPEKTDLGDFNMPENARRMPEAFSPERWFDYHLKSFNNEVDKVPAVTYYVMGPLDGSPSIGNEWRTAESWPVPAEKVDYYLSSEKSLSRQLPEKNHSYGYCHDPSNPVPTVGGRNLFLASGPKDQSLLERRDDMVVFTSEPLEADLEITGDIVAFLHVASDAVENNVVVRFCDVYPDGRSILISDALVNVIGPVVGEPVEVAVDLWPTSLIVARGHYLRVSVSGSNYPKYEIASSGSGNVAHHQLHVGQKYPSRIIFPVVVTPK